MIIFKTYTLESVQNSQTTSNNFLKMYFRLFLEFTPKKIFVISRKASMKFFKGCIHDYFQNIHIGKGLKQVESFKEFFKNAFKMILRKNLHSGKFSNKHQGKVSLFGHQRKLKNLGNHPKQVFSRRILKWKLIIKESRKIFDFTRDNSFFSANGEWTNYNRG